MDVRNLMGSEKFVMTDRHFEIPNSIKTKVSESVSSGIMLKLKLFVSNMNYSQGCWGLRCVIFFLFDGVIK